ncbi:hypothetical protein BP00DRAFT_414887 [Aspergillus indologenus CBS 114.80]|uniref:Uncharacterized protein n=1 Tax=Aspergillus indologenus CBS 114.80 TaxID=1450541 RepID=A0A2V5JB51_9EURO|nr:hypothetical protein BP00DRAFT_414887 [Aspergillus indologenus CBS 114.80]
MESEKSRDPLKKMFSDLRKVLSTLKPSHHPRGVPLANWEALDAAARQHILLSEAGTASIPFSRLTMAQVFLYFGIHKNPETFNWPSLGRQRPPNLGRHRDDNPSCTHEKKITRDEESQKKTTKKTTSDSDSDDFVRPSSDNDEAATHMSITKKDPDLEISYEWMQDRHLTWKKPALAVSKRSFARIYELNGPKARTQRFHPAAGNRRVYEL